MRLLAALLLLGLAAWVASGALERALLYPFDPTRTAPPEELAETTLATDDGERLVIWFRPPRAGKPTVLYFAGNAGNLALRTERFRAFTQRGYGVVAAGYRGNSGSTGRPSETALIADARLLARALPDLAGPGPVVYYGESLGAAVALALAETHPPAAVVLEAPFASVAQMSAHLYGTPALARLLTDRWPSLERIATLTAPLLILHGEHDNLVPPAQSRALFAAAPSGDKAFHLVSGASHVDVWQVEAQQRLFAFLARIQPRPRTRKRTGPAGMARRSIRYPGRYQADRIW